MSFSMLNTIPLCSKVTFQKMCNSFIRSIYCKRTPCFPFKFPEPKYKYKFPVDLRHMDHTSLNMNYRQIKSRIHLQTPGIAPPQNSPEMGRIYRGSQKEEKTRALSISKRKPPGDKFIAACFMTVFTCELCLLLALTRTRLNDGFLTGG